VTLAIIKPDILISSNFNSKVEKILSIAQQNGLQVIQTKRLTLSKNEAEKFYADHKGKFFFQRLVSFMTR
jgi:nucleoside-diphosphate kinase